MILFNFGHNNLMGVFCLYVCYSTLRYSTWITSLVYLILPQSLTHSFKLELHLYNGFQQWLEPRSDLYTADQNYLVLCQPQTRTTNYILHKYVVDQPVFASALSFTLPYATSPVCHQPCSTFIWHSVLSESSSHNRFFEQNTVKYSSWDWDEAEWRGVGQLSDKQ